MTSVLSIKIIITLIKRQKTYLIQQCQYSNPNLLPQKFPQLFPSQSKTPQKQANRPFPYNNKMFKNIFNVKVGKAICGSTRNINSYYIIIFNQQRTVKWISRTMRNDQDCDDVVVGQGIMQPAFIQFWNYDKMTLIDTYKVDFKSQNKYVWQIYQDNLQLTVEKQQNEIQKSANSQSKISQLSNQKESNATPNKSKFSQKTVQIHSAKMIRSDSKSNGQGSSTLIPMPPRPKKKEQEQGSNQLTE